MQSEWARCRLADVVTKLGSGATPRGGADVYVDEGIGLIRSQNVRDNGFSFIGLAYITNEAARQLANVEVEEGDVLVNITGDSVARVSSAPRSIVPARVNQHVAIVRADPSKADPRFLRMLLVSPRRKAELLSLAAAGATRKALTKQMLADLELCLPPLDEQRAIADVLGALDGRIESNRRLANRYDATWLCYGTHALRGAETASVQELLDDGILVVNDGYRARNSELAAEGIAFVRARNLTDHGLDLTGADRVPADLAARVGNKRSQTWDTAFTSKGTVGRITLVDPDAQKFVYSPQVCFWRSLDAERLSPFVLHAWMRGGRFSAQIDAVKGQTDMADYVSLRDQRAMRFDLPTPTAQRTVADFAEPLARAASAVRKESRTLSAIRDALLPKLVSGQIRIPLSDDVEEGVSAAIEALA